MIINIFDYFPNVVCLNCVTTSNHIERRKSAERELLKIMPVPYVNDSDRFMFSDMVRIPGLEDIIRGYDQRNRIVFMGESSIYSDKSLRCFDYSLNLVMLFTRLLTVFPKRDYFFFYEDDVHFSNDPELWRNVLDNCPYSDIMLFDGHIAHSQKELSFLTEENPYWYRYDGIVWNISCFALSRKGMEFLRDIMRDFLANPDYFTWATPDTKINDRFTAEYPIYTKFERISRHIVKVPTAKQWFEEDTSIHGQKGNDNSIEYPSDYT